MSSVRMYMNIVLRRFLHNHQIMAISRQKEARSRDYAVLLFRKTPRVLYSAQYHREPCTLNSFEQFGALYMHNHDDKYPSRPGFEPCTPRSQAPIDTNEPSGPAPSVCRPTFIFHSLISYYHDYWNIHIPADISWDRPTGWPKLLNFDWV